MQNFATESFSERFSKIVVARSVSQVLSLGVKVNWYAQSKPGWRRRTIISRVFSFIGFVGEPIDYHLTLTTWTGSLRSTTPHSLSWPFHSSLHEKMNLISHGKKTTGRSDEMSMMIWFNVISGLIKRKWLKSTDIPTWRKSRDVPDTHIDLAIPSIGEVSLIQVQRAWKRIIAAKTTPLKMAATLLLHHSNACS